MSFTRYSRCRRPHARCRCQVTVPGPRYIIRIEKEKSSSGYENRDVVHDDQELFSSARNVFANTQSCSKWTRIKWTATVFSYTSVAPRHAVHNTVIIWSANVLFFGRSCNYVTHNKCMNVYNARCDLRNEALAGRVQNVCLTSGQLRKVEIKIHSDNITAVR